MLLRKVVDLVEVEAETLVDDILLRDTLVAQNKLHHHFVLFLSSLETLFESRFGFLVPAEAEQLLVDAYIGEHNPVKQLELFDQVAASLPRLFVRITLLLMSEDESIEVFSSCLMTFDPHFDHILEPQSGIFLERLEVALTVKLLNVGQVRCHCDGTDHL